MGYLFTPKEIQLFPSNCPAYWPPLLDTCDVFRNIITGTSASTTPDGNKENPLNAEIKKCLASGDALQKNSAFHYSFTSD